MYFYNHAIINTITQNPLGSKIEWYKESGIQNKRDFLIQLQQLIADDHLQYNFGDYWPNALSLWVSLKIGGVYIDRIDIKYIPPKDLQELMNVTDVAYDDEEGFGFQLFIKYIPITHQNKGWLEKANKIQLDLDKYNYYLGAEFMNLKRLREEAQKKKIIIHVDDHWIFSEGMKKGIRDIYFPESEWHYFDHSDKAIRFIQERFATEEPIDLIITDINRIDVDGYQFAKIVRELEIDYRVFHTPMVVVSMGAESDPRVQKGLEEGLFDKSFGKSVDTRVLGNYLRNLIDYTGFPYNGGKPCFKEFTA